MKALEMQVSQKVIDVEDQSRLKNSHLWNEVESLKEQIRLEFNSKTSKLD